MEVVGITQKVSMLGMQDKAQGSLTAPTAVTGAIVRRAKVPSLTLTRTVL